MNFTVTVYDLNTDNDEEIDVDILEFTLEEFLEKYPKGDFAYEVYVYDGYDNNHVFSSEINETLFEFAHESDENKQAIVNFAKMKADKIQDIDIKNVLSRFYGEFKNKREFFERFFDYLYIDPNTLDFILDNFNYDDAIEDLSTGFEFWFEKEKVYAYKIT